MRILSISPSHDSNVSVIDDGELIFYCKEERVTRKKRDSIPFKSLNLAYQKFGKTIDFCLYSWGYKECEYFEIFKSYIRKTFDCDLLENPINETLEHHLNHASLSFYNSGFDESICVVIDRNGSIFSSSESSYRESESVYRCSYPDKFIPLYKSFSSESNLYDNEIYRSLKEKYINTDISLSDFSIVRIYEAATTLIGQCALENAKTMGLSSFGNYDPEKKYFNGIVPISDEFCYINFYKNGSMPTSCFSGNEHLIVENVDRNSYQFYADRAKQVQIETQKSALNLIKKYVDKTGIKNVCVSGGYGLNVIANKFYIENLPDVNFYFEPNCDDSGNSIGISLLKYRQISKDCRILPINNIFYHYYDENEVLSIPNSLSKKNNPSVKELVKILIDQKPLILFEGNPEAGPRALGHRSILFDCRNPNGKEIINKIKRREWYRPFAGVILEEKFSDYFYSFGMDKSEYMTVAFDCNEKYIDNIKSVIHVDGTCRIQTVSSGFLYTLLSQFYSKTECPILLNTSFNLAGNPLVQTKEDAISEYYEMKKIYPDIGGIYFVDDQVLVS